MFIKFLLPFILSGSLTANAESVTKPCSPQNTEDMHIILANHLRDLEHLSLNIFIFYSRVRATGSVKEYQEALQKVIKLNPLDSSRKSMKIFFEAHPECDKNEMFYMRERSIPFK